MTRKRVPGTLTSLTDRLFRRLLVSSFAATLGWSTVGFGGEVSKPVTDLTASKPAVALANKPASVSSDEASVNLVSYDLFAQNETPPGPKLPATPPRQPSLKTPPITPGAKDPESKQPASGKVPAPPADNESSVSPTTTTPAETPPANPFAFSPGSNRPSLFSALERPGQRPFINNRLSRAPDIFGDSFIPLSADIDVGGLTGMTAQNTSFANTDIPVGGGMRRFKNEHARALPTDRVFLLYNHFHNALRFQTDNSSTTDSVDQFTFGFERMSDDGQWSFELRMPFSGQADLEGEGVAVQADGVGNLVGTLKRLLYSDSSFAAAVGFAVVMPTGSDASVTFRNSNSRIDFENQAVHLLPYLALQATPDENWFFHTFAQVDVAANENDVSIIGNGFAESDSLADQTLLYLDASAGYWWYQSGDDSGLTGLASVVELHYTTTLNDADTANLSGALIGNFENRYDVLNLTVGIHSEWNGNTALRVAVVVPLDREERFFDSETQVSLIRRY